RRLEARGERYEMNRVALLLLVLTVVPAPVWAGEFEDRGSPIEADGIIAKVNLGPNETWPLRIERGKVVCQGDAVFIADGATAYPLNGSAQALTRKHPEGRRPLEDIWLVDEKSLADLKASGAKVKMVRLDISPVLKRAVQWC